MLALAAICGLFFKLSKNPMLHYNNEQQLPLLPLLLLLLSLQLLVRRICFVATLITFFLGCVLC